MAFVYQRVPKAKIIATAKTAGWLYVGIGATVAICSGATHHDMYSLYPRTTISSPECLGAGALGESVGVGLVAGTTWGLRLARITAPQVRPFFSSLVQGIHYASTNKTSNGNTSNGKTPN
jgi:hypothetical protein